MPLINQKTPATPDTSGAATFTDPRDGNVYRTVKIGNQVWMAENLRYNIEGSCCYDSDEANCQKYDRLYTWEAAKKACPAGWHLPTREEWRELVRAVDPNAQLNEDGWDNANVAGKKLKSTGDWYLGHSAYNHDYWDGTDEYGFSAHPDDGSVGCWWTAMAYGSSKAYYRFMDYCDNSVHELCCNIDEMFSVRCVKD
jgi:uncharacterized protein (TIGR02145 family)